MADRNNRKISIGVAVRGWRQVDAAMRSNSTSALNLGRNVAASGRDAQRAERGWGLFERRQVAVRKSTDKTRHSFGGLARAGAGLGAGYFAFEGITKSVDKVDALGESIHTLHNVQGLSNKSAAEFAVVADVNGISARSLGAGLGLLAKSSQAAAKQQRVHAVTQKYSVSTTKRLAAANAAYQDKLMGLGATARDDLKRQQYADAYHAKRSAILTTGQGKSALAAAKGIGAQAEAYKALGIKQSVLKRGNTRSLFLKTADALGRMRGGTKKNAIELAIFGRGYQRLQPLLRTGELSFREQVKWAHKYGVTVGIETPKQIEHFKAAQLQSKYATEGFQVAVGTQLLPALTTFLPVLASGVRDLTGLAGWLGKNKTLTRDLGLGFLGIGALIPLSKLARMGGWLFKILKWARDLRGVKVADNMLIDGLGTVGSGTSRRRAVRSTVKSATKAGESELEKDAKRYGPAGIGAVLRSVPLVGAAATAGLFYARNRKSVDRFVTSTPGRAATAGTGAFNALFGASRRHPGEAALRSLGFGPVESVLNTRAGNTGQRFTPRGTLNITAAAIARSSDAQIRAFYSRSPASRAQLQSLLASAHRNVAGLGTGTGPLGVPAAGAAAGDAAEVVPLLREIAAGIRAGKVLTVDKEVLAAGATAGHLVQALTG